MNKKFGLEEYEMDPSPFIQFGKWFQERLNSGVVIPESVSLGTSASDGSVSVRTVLLKEYDQSGFVFFSNYNSRKGIQIDHNPRVALLFYWPESDRQIRIEGTVHKVPPEESDRYFITRPEESRLSAWASEQSTVIPDRQYLEDRFETFRNKFFNGSIDRPAHWGGYRLKPTWFEFWQAGEHRLHDRICYSLTEDKWLITRLAP